MKHEQLLQIFREKQDHENMVRNFVTCQIYRIIWFFNDGWGKLHELSTWQRLRTLLGTFLLNTVGPGSRLEKKSAIDSWNRHALCDLVTGRGTVENMNTLYISRGYTSPFTHG